MSRPRAFFTTTPEEPFPFNRTTGDPAGADYKPLDGITLAQMMRTWFLEDEKVINITIPTDGSVPPFVSSTDYAITLVRTFCNPPPVGLEAESALLHPGFEEGLLDPGAFQWNGYAQWGGEPEDPGYQGPDAYWNRITFSVVLNYCGVEPINGWRSSSPADPDYPIPKDRYTYESATYAPTFRLVVTINLNDGDYISWLQTPAPAAYGMGTPTGYNFVETGNMDGVNFDYSGVEWPTFITAPVTLEVSTTKFFEYRPAGGGAAIYDQATGAELLDPLAEPTD